MKLLNNIIHIFHSRSKFLKITLFGGFCEIIPNHEKCKVGGILDEGKFKIDKVFKYGKFGTISGCGKLLEI
ncbi:hypothetical protein ACD574_04770 [Campylobacter sp. LH-2024]|uniref:hypothetical protein n=1 Tax=Campylobacter sp. LH-2024 TaxID=3239825 RepID=UPI003B79DC4A